MEVKDYQSDITPVPLESSNKPEVQQTPAIKDTAIVRTFSSAGIRPIGASNLKVAKTMNVMGIRPIGTHTLDVAYSMNVCGIRPITYSSLVIYETHAIAGNRPVAANTINDADSLMVFLD